MCSVRADSSVPLAALMICIKFDYLIIKCTVHTHSRNPAGFIKILSVRRPHPTRVTNGLLKSQQQTPVDLYSSWPSSYKILLSFATDGT